MLALPLALLTASSIYSLSATADATVLLPRGVDPALSAHYTQPSFTCLDGSKTIPKDRVNDGYCDCFLGECGVLRVCVCGAVSADACMHR